MNIHTCACGLQTPENKLALVQGLASDSDRAASFTEAQPGLPALGRSSAAEDVAPVDPPEEVAVPHEGPSSRDYEPPTAGRALLWLQQ